MILCEFTPAGGGMIRCAMDDFSDIHLWKSYITSIASIKIAMPQRWGGYAAPTFSDISFSPDMFSDTGNWPPPESATVRMLWIAGIDETDGTEIFSGTAVVGDIGLTEIKYNLKRPDMAATVAAATAYADTLVAVMTTLCGASLLNLTIDTTRARIPSPAVSYTTTDEILAIDFASDLCACFAHGFYIEAGTLYLIDMYDITTMQEAVSEWDITSASYRYDSRYSTAKCGDYTVSSATVLNGDELTIATAYHGTQANIEDALDIILAIANRPTIELNAMITDDPLTIGQCYVFTDESAILPLQSICLASDVVYNFDSETSQAVGAGSIA